jgi:hypothetical protein
MSGKGFRFPRRTLFALAGLLALLFAIRGEENWRAARALAQCEKELRDAGEKLELSDFLPPAVPDADNFAAAPIVAQLPRIAANSGDRKLTPEEERLDAVSLSHPPFKPGRPERGDWEAGRVIDLFKWAQYLEAPASAPNDAAQKVVDALARFSPVLSEFAEAAARPAAVFRANYDQGLHFNIHHFSILTRLAEIYGLRGVALLHAGQPDLAFRDLETLYRLQSALQPEPLLISFLVRRTLFHFFDQLLWEGLAAQAWNPAQLQQIQAQLERLHWLADYAHAIRGERAFVRLIYSQLRDSPRGPQQMQAEQSWNSLPPIWDRLLRILPGVAVLDWNEARQERALQEVLIVIERGGEKIERRKIEALERSWHDQMTTPYNIFVKETLPIQSTIILRAATAAVATEEARTACAVEHFRLTNGLLPDNLSALVPTYLPKPPVDPLGNGPLRFRVGPDSAYRLYSIGWNETDEGGEIAFKAGEKRRDDQAGDWVWPSAPR